MRVDSDPNRSKILPTDSRFRPYRCVSRLVEEKRDRAGRWKRAGSSESAVTHLDR